MGVSTVASMTTYPPRYEMALRTMKRLSRMVDHVFCYVNGDPAKYDHPSWDKETRKNVTPILASEEGGDLGDVGKFYPLKYVTGQAYVLLLDDDIRYPDNYPARMRDYVDRFDRRHIVGVHGCDLPDDPVESYYEHGQLSKRNFSQGLDRPRPAHLLGTGTVAFWSERVNVHAIDFPVQNMADILFARYCQREQIGMVMVPRPAGWLRSYPTPDEGIWGRFQGKDETQTWLINTTTWTHHAHITEPS